MKHIVVTGGARGIGRAIVEELAGGDYKITATYNGSKTAADELAAKYSKVEFVQADLQDRKAVARCAEEITKRGPVDVLVNNAGVYIPKSFAKMIEAELLQQTDLNFTALALLTHKLLPALRQAEAALIINISSQAVHARLTGEAVYSAVKAGVSTLSYVLRAELNPEGIRVTAIEPFGVNTYGMPEPSNMILPGELAQTVRYVVELPDHLQLDTVGMSHIKQTRPTYPEWIEH
jgi:NAD(P)-dependent dehydrogenase (short-subunit alcohol dehydrogenase family)